MIPWENIYFYYRESEELKKPHLMVVSSIFAGAIFRLSDYSVLRENV